MKYSDLCRILLQIQATSVRLDANELPCWCDGINAHSDWCATIRHATQQIEWAIEDEFPAHDASFKELPGIH